MPHEELLLIKKENSQINIIVSHVFQAIISIQEQQPELLTEKDKHIQWRNNNIETKFAAILSQTADWNVLIQKLHSYLKTWLIPESFNSPILIELIGKMIAFGSSIHERYPNAKEVFVCSSDTVMTNLCNHIQQHGLIVYRVSKQGETVKVFNFSTGNTVTSVPILPAKISSIEKFIEELKILIKKEQINTQSFWIKLSRLSEIFKNTYQVTISQVVSQYLPGKKARDIFINYPADFVIHQIDATSELYVTLLEVNQSQPVDSNNEAKFSSTTESSLPNISTTADFEQALMNIIKILTKKSSDNFVNAEILASEFNKKYSKSITQKMNSLHINGSFIKFLQSSSCFTLKQTDKGWKVGKS